MNKISKDNFTKQKKKQRIHKTRNRYWKWTAEIMKINLRKNQKKIMIRKINNIKNVIEQPQVKPKTKRFCKDQENTKFSQVKNHLIEKGQIDSWTAINLYGATRLSAIIFDLKKAGYNIRSVRNTAFDRNNKICNFTTYIFKENEIN